MKIKSVVLLYEDEKKMSLALTTSHPLFIILTEPGILIVSHCGCKFRHHMTGPNF